VKLRLPKKPHLTKKEWLHVFLTIVLSATTIVNARIAFSGATDIWGDITDFSMVIVAIGALVTAIYASHLQRLHNYKSLKPLLNFNYSSSENKKFMRLSLRNDGKGPAIIKSFSISNKINNHHLPRNRVFESFAKATLGSSITAGATYFENGDVIKSESEYPLAVIDFSDSSSVSLEQAKRFVLGLKVHIEYTDVYDRKYYPAIQVFEKDIA